jgi:uncharacterized repeat protein (TIGR03803 family)
MRNAQGNRGWAAVTMAAILLTLAAAIAAPAQTFEVLYTFTGGMDGGLPTAGLIRDGAGNLYGATADGGYVTSYCEEGCGTVFKLQKNGKETVLHKFRGVDGGTPSVGNLVHDQSGNLYGATVAGGDLACALNNGYGCGTIFKLDSTGKETVLYRFAGGTDGSFPNGGLALDSAGNVYGTTSEGGDGSCIITSDGCGVVFKVDQSGQQTVLYTFTGGADGGFPATGVVMDVAGNLYGTTRLGGDSSCGPPYGCGTVFKLDRAGTETVLHAFGGGADGATPYAPLLRDPVGNLYGTTYQGGSGTTCGGLGCGTVFKVRSTGTETILYSFAGNPDGASPVGALTGDAAGNLYGTTAGGGFNDAGTVFMLDKTGAETILYNFNAQADGGGPLGTLARDSTGTLYGIAGYGGGINGTEFGTVFIIKP